MYMYKKKNWNLWAIFYHIVRWLVLYGMKSLVQLGYAQKQGRHFEPMGKEQMAVHKLQQCDKMVPICLIW